MDDAVRFNGPFPASGELQRCCPAGARSIYRASIDGRVYCETSNGPVPAKCGTSSPAKEPVTMLDTRSAGYRQTFSRLALSAGAPQLAFPSGTSGVTDPSLGATIGGAVSGSLGGGSWADVAGQLAGSLFDKLITPKGGGSAPVAPVTPLVAPTNGTRCGPGQTSVLGRCVDFEAALPGGEPFVQNPGKTVKTALGAAFEPLQVGSYNDGSPILRCPRRHVLGMDNLCYHKAVIPRGLRKWVPAPRPVITAGDQKAIRRAAAATKRVKKLAGKVGLTTHARGAHRSSSSSKRKKC